jgi:hypothetical protein
MISKNSQFVLYKSFVDAFMKGHPGMTKYVNLFFNNILFFFLNKVFHFLGLSLQCTNRME